MMRIHGSHKPAVFQAFSTHRVAQLVLLCKGPHLQGRAGRSGSCRRSAAKSKRQRLVRARALGTCLVAGPGACSGARAAPRSPCSPPSARGPARLPRRPAWKPWRLEGGLTVTRPLCLKSRNSRRCLPCTPVGAAARAQTQPAQRVAWRAWQAWPLARGKWARCGRERTHAAQASPRPSHLCRLGRHVVNCHLQGFAGQGFAGQEVFGDGEPRGRERRSCAAAAAGTCAAGWGRAPACQPARRPRPQPRLATRHVVLRDVDDLARTTQGWRRAAALS